MSKELEEIRNAFDAVYIESLKLGAENNALTELLLRHLQSSLPEAEYKAIVKKYFDMLEKLMEKRFALLEKDEYLTRYTKLNLAHQHFETLSVLRAQRDEIL